MLRRTGGFRAYGEQYARPGLDTRQMESIVGSWHRFDSVLKSYCQLVHSATIGQAFLLTRLEMNTRIITRRTKFKNLEPDIPTATPLIC